MVENKKDKKRKERDAEALAAKADLRKTKVGMEEFASIEQKLFKKDPFRKPTGEESRAKTELQLSPEKRKFTREQLIANQKRIAEIKALGGTQGQIQRQKDIDAGIRTQQDIDVSLKRNKEKLEGKNLFEQMKRKGISGSIDREGVVRDVSGKVVTGDILKKHELERKGIDDIVPDTPEEIAEAKGKEESLLKPLTEEEIVGRDVVEERGLLEGEQPEEISGVRGGIEALIEPDPRLGDQAAFPLPIAGISGGGLQGFKGLEGAKKGLSFKKAMENVRSQKTITNIARANNIDRAQATKIFESGKKEGIDKLLGKMTKFAFNPSVLGVQFLTFWAGADTIGSFFVVGGARKTVADVKFNNLDSETANIRLDELQQTLSTTTYILNKVKWINPVMGWAHSKFYADTILKEAQTELDRAKEDILRLTGE